MVKNNLGQTKEENSKNYPRLPCRGCTRQCKNYDKCNGKPWRLDSDLIK